MWVYRKLVGKTYHTWILWGWSQLFDPPSPVLCFLQMRLRCFCCSWWFCSLLGKRRGLSSQKTQQKGQQKMTPSLQMLHVCIHHMFKNEFYPSKINALHLMTSVSLENGEAGLTCVAWVLSSPSMQRSRHPPKDAIVNIFRLGNLEKPWLVNGIPKRRFLPVLDQPVKWRYCANIPLFVPSF